MKTPKELNKIYDRFPKDKIELTKIELGVADEINKAVVTIKKELEKVSEINKETKEVNKVNNALAKEIDKRDKITSKLAEASEKLEKTARDVEFAANDVLGDAFKAAKDLGVDAKAIKGYNELDKLFNKILSVKIENVISYF